MAKESAAEALGRWELLALVQDEYREFLPFLFDVFALMGWEPSEVQLDIALVTAYGPHYLMIQAQRGQAKTTIVAAYAVWCLIHDPKFRILITSAGGTQANEIATFITRIILNMEVLECMRPDASAGDKTSVEGFDIHHSLKGLEKSPSVACVGIFGNLQGKRADLLVADDVESQKNGLTAKMREQLDERMRDFASICETGRIIYLGTPQSRDSVYNSLASRGFSIYVYPGRFPTAGELPQYGTHLAPYILRMIQERPSLQHGGGLLGDAGQPVDTRLDEGVLQQKEQYQGKAFFQLQHMLNTALLDAGRYPLKPEQLLAMHVNGPRFPMLVVPNPAVTRDYAVHGHTFRMGTILPPTDPNEYAPLQAKVLAIDPAGGGKNGDETGYAVVGFLNGNVFLLDVGGVPGGYETSALQALADVAKRHAVNEVRIEKNFGHGAFTAVFTPILRAAWPECKISEHYVTGQKERRIQEVLEPVMGRGSLVVDEALVKKDEELADRYGREKRLTYSFFYQLSRLTLTAGALGHDDRLDAVAGGVAYFVESMAVDQSKKVAAQKAAEVRAWLKDPLRHSRYSTPSVGRRARSTLAKRYSI